MPDETTAQKLQRIYETRELCHVANCGMQARGTFASTPVTFPYGAIEYLDIALCPDHAKALLGADAPR